MLNGALLMLIKLFKHKTTKNYWLKLFYHVDFGPFIVSFDDSKF